MFDLQPGLTSWSWYSCDWSRDVTWRAAVAEQVIRRAHLRMINDTFDGSRFALAIASRHPRNLIADVAADVTDASARGHHR